MLKLCQKQPTLLEVPDITARERDADFVDFGSERRSSSVVVLFSLSDVATHLVLRVARR